MKHTMILFLGLFTALSAGAQINLEPATLDRLTAAGLEMIYPLESDYRALEPVRNDYMPYEFALRSRRERLEIRYHVIPEIAMGEVAGLPHVDASRMAIHLASNDEDVVITGHSMDEKQLYEQFNADWGKMFTFRPKRSFAATENCRLLALYREGSGMAYIVFLFDEAPATLDQRLLALRFTGPQAAPR